MGLKARPGTPLFACSVAADGFGCCMKKIKDSHVGMAILGAVFVFFAVSYVGVRAQKDTENRLDRPIDRDAVEGPRLAAHARANRAQEAADAPALTSGVALVDKARLELNEVRSAIESPALRSDTRLKAVRIDVLKALKHLDDVRCEFAPMALAKPASYLTTAG